MSPTTLVRSCPSRTEISASTMCSRRRHRTPVIRLYCSSGTLTLAIGSLLGFPRTSDSLVGFFGESKKFCTPGHFVLCDQYLIRLKKSPVFKTVKSSFLLVLL